jgi:acyl carrier protein
MDKKTAITDYIKNEVIHNRNAPINEADDLISAGIIDSLGILQLVAFISDSFGIEVPDEDVVYENFHSIEAISNYLQKYS